MTTKTILSILGIIIVIIGALFLKLDSVYGQNLSDVLEKATTQMMADCVIQFDTGILNTYTLLCRSFMNDLDKLCQQQYHSYCFGTAWKDFDLTKHVNPP